MLTPSRLTSLVVGTALTMAFVLACSGESSRRSIRVGILQHGSAIPFVVADRKGLFTKHGLHVELQGVSAQEQMPSLLRGDVDVISPSSFPVILSTAQQNPGRIRCFLTGGESLAGDVIYGLVVSRTRKARSLDELRGGTIGSASKFTTVNLRNVLAARFPPNDTTTVREFGDQAVMLQALHQGSIEAAVVDQPALSSDAIQSDYDVIEPNFRARYLGDPYWSGAAVVDSRWLATNATAFTAFLDAIDDALAICKTDPTGAKRLFVEYFHLRDVDENAIGMYVYPNARFSPPPDQLSRLQTSLVAAGMLREAVDLKTLFVP